MTKNHNTPAINVKGNQTAPVENAPAGAGLVSVPSADQLIQYRKIRTVDSITRNFRFAALLVFLSFCVWVLGDTIKAFAGQTTDFAAIVGIFVDSGAGITISLSVTLNLFLGSWAILERRLRHRKTEDLATRKAAAERLIDSRRTSSELRPDGSTNPEDF